MREDDGVTALAMAVRLKDPRMREDDGWGRREDDGWGRREDDGWGRRG